MLISLVAIILWLVDSVEGLLETFFFSFEKKKKKNPGALVLPLCDSDLPFSLVKCM